MRCADHTWRRKHCDCSSRRPIRLTGAVAGFRKVSLPSPQSTFASSLLNYACLAPRRVHRKPTWGTCAGLILLAESANRTKQGGQELIGGLDVRVNRNHFGRQTESFQTPLTLDFLADDASGPPAPFNGVFIRAPVVEKILPHQAGKSQRDDCETVVAPSHPVQDQNQDTSADKDRSVEVLAKLPGRAARLTEQTGVTIDTEKDAGDIVAVKQGNVFGTSFHPELTDDPRIHLWWLRQVRDAVHKRSGAAQLPVR